MTYDINLPWKSFNVDLNTVVAWIQANAGSAYAGASADYDLSLHYTSEPGDVVRAAVASYWAAVDISSSEHTNYMSESDRVAAAAANKAAKLATATSKLEALGLTADEIAAIIS